MNPEQHVHITRSCRKINRTWCLDSFEVEDVRSDDQKALADEVQGFSENTGQRKEGLKGYALVGEILGECKSIVSRVAKREVGENMIVCGKSARRWDSAVKDSKTELYESMIDLWHHRCLGIKTIVIVGCSRR